MSLTGLRERLAVLVDHCDRVARGERAAATGREGADLVEVDDAEARQGVEIRWLARVALARDARVDRDGRREAGVDRKAGRLLRRLVGEEVRAPCRWSAGTGWR